MVVFKMRESVPTARYSPVCNVLRQWKTSLILTYRVYRLYDIKNILVFVVKYDSIAENLIPGAVWIKLMHSTLAKRLNDLKDSIKNPHSNNSIDLTESFCLSF